MVMNKLNNKGYMLVEIILASAIAFGITYFIMDMTINLKNKNDDLLVETLTMTDQAIITNMIMEKIKEDPNEFKCEDVNLVEGKSFVVGSKTNIVNEYANVKYDSCKIEPDKITVKVSLVVPQIKSKNFNVDVTYYKNIVNPYLYEEVSIGDYIAYTGNNGCTGNQCSGWNANQVSTTSVTKFGYCYAIDVMGSSGNYVGYGWRVLYKTSDSVYIISAGSPECVGDTYNNINLSRTTLNNTALKYCNNSYIADGLCNSTTAHAFNGLDFYTFTSQYYSDARYLYEYNDGGKYGEPYCYNKSSSDDLHCGHDNDIINNGSNYWFATAGSSTYLMGWDISSSKIIMPTSRTGTYDGDTAIYDPIVSGVRPVLKLDSSIKITGGTGTMNEPYEISTRS